MSPQNSLRLLFLTALCLISFVSARKLPISHEQPKEEHDNGVPAIHAMNKNGVAVVQTRGHVDPNLQKICGHTDHPALCVSSISPLIKGKATVDNALDASIKAGTDFAKHALNMVKRLSKKSSPDMSSTYKDCMDFYKNALDGFGETLDAHPAHDLGTMKSQLSGVITWLSTCEDEFSESGGVSPLTGYADKLTSLTSNSLAIVDQMH